MSVAKGNTAASKPGTVIIRTGGTSMTCSIATRASSGPRARRTADASLTVRNITSASADGETSGVKVVVQELKRTSGGTVSMKFTITNGSDKEVGGGYSYGDKDHEIIDHGSVGGVQLVDEAGKKKYLVVRDSGAKCVCSQGLKDIKEGETVSLWARFPAPPDNVQKITVLIPHFQPMDDVPISK